MRTNDGFVFGFLQTKRHRRRVAEGTTRKQIVATRPGRNVCTYLCVSEAKGRGVTHTRAGRTDGKTDDARFRSSMAAAGTRAATTSRETDGRV